MFFFKSLYIYIYNFGLLIQSVIKKICRFLFGWLIDFAVSRRSEGGASKKNTKKFAVCLCALVLAAALLFNAVWFLKLNSVKTQAVEVFLNGESLGCVSSQDEADLAKAKAINETHSPDDIQLTYKDIKTDACNLISESHFFDTLMQKVFPEYIKAVEIYINGKLLCATPELAEAQKVFEERLESAQTVYPTAAVAFAEEVSFKYAYYKTGSETLWTPDKLRISLKTLSVLTPQHTECEQTLSPVDFDTVEIETNKLFIGDSRVRREGKDGSEYVISLVTYNGEKKVLSQHLTSLTVTAPVSKIIERGMRAESLSMGSYTVTQTSGMFCWPVVGLYNVTSPFGYRSLGYHQGIDISGANASGSLVVAGAAGTVVEAGWSTGGYGNYVKIDHGNGIETLYGHMLDNSLMVSVGDFVTKGQAIGRVGNTGYSFGAHLHFEVRINGTRVNPARYLGLE